MSLYLWRATRRTVDVRGPRLTHVMILAGGLLVLAAELLTIVFWL